MKRNNKGFTLAELMLVLMILVIMTTAIIVSGRGIIKYVNETITKSEARQYMNFAQTVINQEYAENLYGEGAIVIDSDTADSDEGLFASFEEACGKMWNHDIANIYVMSDTSITMGGATVSNTGEITDFSYEHLGRNITVELSLETGNLEIVDGAAPEGGTP